MLPQSLDESGIIRIGAPVKPDDILVEQRSRPSGETQSHAPEEKAAQAIFGERRAM